MGSDRKIPRINPFGVGLVGVLLLVAGCVAGNYLNSPAGESALLDRMQRAARSSSARSDPSVTRTLANVEDHYRARMYWKLAAQVVFFAGVMLVAAAGIIWYQQAQQDEEPEEESGEPADTPGVFDEEEPVL